MLTSLDNHNQSDLDISEDDNHTEDGEGSFSGDAILEAFINDLDQEVDAGYMECDEEVGKLYRSASGLI